MIAWGIEALVASACLMLFVLLVRGRVAALFGPRVAYLLWLLPLARLVLPRLPGIGPRSVALPALTFSGDEPLPEATLAAVPASLPDLPAVATLDWPLLLVALWLGGAVMFFLWQIGAYRRFLGIALRGSSLLCRTCGIAVHHGPNVAGPAAAGILKRRILLPQDFTTRYAPEERRLVLAHEVAHHVRGDLVANVAALVVLSLHWFNPFAHRSYRAFRADQELACDATVLRDEPAELRPIYGAALLKSLNAATPAAACALGGAATLKRRLRMMRTPHLSRTRRTLGAGLVGLVVVQGLWLTASASVATTSRLTPVALAKTPQMVAPVEAAHEVSEPLEPVHAVAHPSAVHTLASRPTAPRLTAAVRVPPAPPVSPAAPTAPTPPAPPAPPAPIASAHVEALASLGDTISAEVRDSVGHAMAQVRVALSARCRFATAPSGAEDDEAAVARLSRGCYDRQAVRAQVEGSLRAAREQIAASQRDLIASQRNLHAQERAIAAQQRAIEAHERAMEKLDRKLERLNDDR